MKKIINRKKMFIVFDKKRNDCSKFDSVFLMLPKKGEGKRIETLYINRKKKQ